MSALDLWLKSLEEKQTPQGEIAQKRSTLEEFCAFAETDPDTLVSDCIDEDAGKIRVKERKRIEALIDEFGAGSTERANVVRSFLIHNGVRLVPPKAPWL